MQKYIDKLSDFNELVMFKHSIFSMPFIFISMIVAANGWFGFKLFVLGVLAALSARNFAMGFNRWTDRKYDILNPRTASRPSVDGRLDSKSIAVFVIINAIVFIATAYLINMLAFWLSFPILWILASYSFFKRFSEMAHIILGLSLALAPIAGVVAVQGSITLWSIFLSVGVMFWVAGFDLLYSLQDIDFDKENNLYSIPSRYGAKTTLTLSALFHVLTILFWGLFVLFAHLHFFGYMAVCVSALMLLYEHYLVRKDFTKIDRVFFTVNGYLGIIFLIFIILDKVVVI